MLFYEHKFIQKDWNSINIYTYMYYPDMEVVADSEVCRDYIF